MIEALIDGERRGPVLAQLAKGTMRSKIADLSMALEGRFGDHHALMCRLHLDHIDHLEATIIWLDGQIEAMMDVWDNYPRPAGAAATTTHCSNGESAPAASSSSRSRPAMPGPYPNHPVGSRRPDRRPYRAAHRIAGAGLGVLSRMGRRGGRCAGW